MPKRRLARALTLVSLSVLVAASTSACSRASHPEPTAQAAAPMPAMVARSAESFDTETYDRIAENDFQTVAQHPLSTFSVDVDTASYSNVRRFLKEGELPPPGAVRIEELVNYFSYDYPEPSGEHPFSVSSEVSEAPWQKSHRLVHVGIKGRSIASEKLPPRNLTFLLDVSGSMDQQNKLPLVKRSMKRLLSTLGERDRVAIVVYAGASGVVLPSTPANQQARIERALDQLSAGGGTNGAEGIVAAYAEAEKGRRPGSVNRVIVATDGDFNLGTTSQSELIRLIEKKRDSGVELTVLGFGMGNLKDSTLEKLADHGNGNYAYIDDIQEARKVLVREAGATLVTIAKDVKIQVEFNPKLVNAYRLIGYENRLLKDEDFNDDTKDAGEIGAGHTVTALYEVVPAGTEAPTGEVDALKYQKPSGLTEAAEASEMLTVKLRYKAPGSRTSRAFTVPVNSHLTPRDETSEAFRFSAAVAGFGMLLRDSKHRGSTSFAMVDELARSGLGADAHGYRREFLGMVKRASELRHD